METISVITNYNNSIREVAIENKAVICPFCRTNIIPKYLFAVPSTQSEINVLAQCTFSPCKKAFIALYDNNAPRKFIQIEPTAMPTVKYFSDTINDLSPNFVVIYNQSYAAEQLSLNQICGTGYRKALEHLIKDYLISIKSEEQHQLIKDKFLNNCIRDDIDNENIKRVAARAVWLGNDETHYTRKWGDKDVSDLKKLIDLTIHWIEHEIQTKEILEDMSEFR